MLTLKYPILQSGFLDFKETGLTKQIPSQSSFADTILFREKNSEYDNFYYSDEITKLFDEYQSNFRVIRSFAFRERILSAAMQRFGADMTGWLVFQSGKPSFSNLHKTFLESMCRWMSASDMTPNDSAEVLKWLSLIGPDEGNAVIFNVSVSAPDCGSITTATAITNWLSKTDGYPSLLNYLFVIFGHRTAYVTQNAIR